MLLRPVSALVLSLVCSVGLAEDAFTESLQSSVVQVHDNHWFVKIRVDQDKPDRPEAGLASRMAVTIGARKLLEFACDTKPAAGDKISGRIAGLLTVSSVSNAEWAEVVLSAPVQKLACKIESALPAKKMEQGPVLNEIRTNY
jgi:hypothetical protein